jgi:hypothetical protein
MRPVEDPNLLFYLGPAASFSIWEQVFAAIGTTHDTDLYSKAMATIADT